MADDDSLPLAQRPHQIDQIADQMEDREVLCPLGRLGLAIAAHIGRHDPVARRRQRLDLRGPADCQFGEAVDQQHQRPLTRRQDRLIQTIGLDFGSRDHPARLSSL